MYVVTEGAQAALDAELGYPFGTLKGVPGIPIHTGARAIVREQFLAGATGLLKVSDLISLDRFPASGQINIQSERLAYSFIDRINIGLFISSRGVGGTTDADHDVGEPISEQLDEQVFVFYEDPGGYQARSIDKVYFNGIWKDPAVTPTHTADANDEMATHDVDTGFQVTTGAVRVDMTAVIPGPFITTTTVTQVQAQQQVAAASPVYYPSSLVHSLHQVTSGGTPQIFLPASIGSVSSPAQVAPDAPPPVTITRTTRRRGPALLPQIGTVTADITGLEDDDAGTITGTPGLLIRNPAYCAKFILKQAFRQTVFDDESFTAAAAACDERGYAWDFLFTRMSLGEFQGLVFRQSQVHVFCELGVWKAKFRERGTPAITLRQARRVSWEMTWTPIAAVLTELAVNYGQNDASQTVTVTSARGQALVDQNPGTIDLPWIGVKGIAKSLGQNHLRLNDHPRREGAAVMHTEAIGIEKQDTVAVEADMLAPYGGTALFWRARGTQIQPDRTIRVLLEEDDAVVDFAAPGAVLITGTDAAFDLVGLLPAGSGTVLITGTPAVLRLVDGFIVANAGTVVITGTDATFTTGVADEGLLEDGTAILLEDGSSLLLET